MEFQSCNERKKKDSSQSFDAVYRDFLITNYIQQSTGKYSYDGVFGTVEITKKASIQDSLGLYAGQRFIINLSQSQLDSFEPKETSESMAFYKIYN